MRVCDSTSGPSHTHTHICGLYLNVCVTNSPEAACFSPLSFRFVFYRFNQISTEIWILCTGTKGERKILRRIKQTNMHIWWSSLTRRYSACGLMSTAGWTVSKLVDDFKGCLSVLFVVFLLGQPCHFCSDPITSTCEMSVPVHDSYFGFVTQKRLNHKCAHMILQFHL